MQLECVLISAAIIGDHERQLCPEVGAEEFCQIKHVRAIYLKMKFVSTLNANVHRPAREFFGQRVSQPREIGHFITTFTT